MPLPAFDPVRDAVLNSPNTPGPSFSSRTRIHIELPSAGPVTNPSPTSSDSARSTTSPLTRRATDLSVLLNSDPPPEHTHTPLFTPTTPRAPTHLSHILHPDSSPTSADDQLSNTQPLRRKPISSADSSYFPESAHLKTATPTPEPVPEPSRPSTATSTTHSATSSPPIPKRVPLPLPPKPSFMPPPPVPSRSVIPYAPRKRFTPPTSVTIPLTPAEVEWYRNYPGGIGSQILRSSGKSNKRGRSVDFGDVNEEPAAKRSRDVGLVVEHCMFHKILTSIIFSTSRYHPAHRQRTTGSRRRQTKRITHHRSKEFQQLGEISTYHTARSPRSGPQSKFWTLSNICAARKRACGWKSRCG